MELTVDLWQRTTLNTKRTTAVLSISIGAMINIVLFLQKSNPKKKNDSKIIYLKIKKVNVHFEKKTIAFSLTDRRSLAKRICCI